MRERRHILRTLIAFLVVGLVILGPMQGWGANLLNQSQENMDIMMTTDLAEVEINQSVVILFEDKSEDGTLTFAIPDGLVFDEAKTVEANQGVNIFTFDEKERVLKGTKRTGKIVLRVSRVGDFQVTANKLVDAQVVATSGLVVTGIAKKVARVARAVNTADVYDDATFRAALNNKDITVINVTKDFQVTANANELSQYFPTKSSLLFNGNGHTVDFQGLSAWFTISAATPMNMTIKDVNILGRNYYGPVRLTGTRGYGKIRYENVTYTGAQITASYEADIDIAGRVECRMVTSYVSLAGATVTTQASNQANFEATNMNFLEGSHYIGNTVNAGAFLLYSGGNVDVGKNAIIDLTSFGNGGEGDTTYATVATQGNISIHDGAKFNINTDAGSRRGGIRASGASSQILVESGGELNINTKGALDAYRHAIYLGNGAGITVQNNAKLNVRAENTAGSTTNIIDTGSSSKFLIGKKATFNVYSDGTASKQLISIGSSALFQFADAASVDLNLNNTNANSRLIYMAGSAGKLVVDVQRVLAWNAIGSTGNKDATYEWNPMYGMNISYTGSNVTAAAGNSLTTPVQDSFRTNFRTQNFKRVLFEYIPDVAVTLDILTDAHLQANSHVITGTTNPGAWVIFSGSTVIPAGTIAAQSVNDATLYHVKADGTGNFSYALPVNKYFTAGETITAKSYLNGKSATATTVVKDLTAPNAPVLNGMKDRDVVISGTAEANATVRVFGADDTVFASGQANAAGVYSIAVPAGKQPLVPYSVYYTKATDAAGNSSTKSNVVTVADTTPPTANPIMQTVDLNAAFTTNAKSLVRDVHDNGGDGDDNLTYTLTKKPNVSVVGYTTAEVRIQDRAGNALFVSIPVFVKDGFTVTNDKAMLQAYGFTVFGKDFPTTLAAVDQMIFTEAKVKAWGVPSGQDVTSQVQIVDRGGLSKTPGSYLVKLSVLGVEKTVVVTVKAGTLAFKDVTQDVSFGTATISSKSKIIAPETDLKVTIEDTRAVISDWKLSVKLTQNLQTSDGEEVANALIVRQKNGLGVTSDMSLGGSATPVYEDKTGVDGVKVVDMAPNQSQSILLNIEPGTVKANKEYTAQMEWTLENGP